MFQADEPIFKKHTVLHASALQDGVSIPRKITEGLYNEYSDGILSGVHIKQMDEWLIIEPGVIHYHGHLYYMCGEKKLPLKHDNKTAYVRVNFMETSYEENMVKRSSDILISTEESARDNEMELCHFQYQKGADLKNVYRSFKDYSAVYNTINIVDAPYAALGESTISPCITRRFGEEMLQKELKDPFDIAFSLECLGGEAVSRKVLMFYINHKLHTKSEKMTNSEIHKYMTRILDSEANGTQDPKHYREVRRIMI